MKKIWILICCTLMAICLLTSNIKAEDTSIKFTPLEAYDVQGDGTYANPYLVPFIRGYSLTAEHVSIEGHEYSYKWYMSDANIGSPFKELIGQTATSKTLIVNTSDYGPNKLEFMCEITDKTTGNEVDEAYAYVLGYRDKDPADFGYPLILGDYHIWPGETIDLSAKGMGSGTISLSEDGSHVKLDNVNYVYDPANCIADQQLSGSLSFTYYLVGNKLEDVYFELVGDNTFTNLFHDPSGKGDGIGFTCQVLSASHLGFVSKPFCHFVGDGSLNLVGSSNGVYINSWVEVDSKITIKHLPDIINRPLDGFEVDGIVFTPNAKVEMDICGNGVYAPTKNHDDYMDSEIILQEGSNISITSTNAPREGNLPSRSHGFIVKGNFIAKSSTVNINLIADGEAFKGLDETKHPYSYYGISANEFNVGAKGSIDIIDSKINITLTNKNVSSCQADPENFLISSVMISGEEKITINNSSVIQKINEIEQASVQTIGIEAPELVIDNSTVNFDLRASQAMNGIKIDNKLDIKNSDVTIDVEASDNPFGIYLDKDAVANINLDNTDHHVNINCKNNKGYAIAALLGSGNTELSPDENYEPQHILLSKLTKINDKHDINVYSENTQVSLALDDEPQQFILAKEYDEYPFTGLNVEYQLDDQLLNSPDLGKPAYRYYETILQDEKPATSALIFSEKPRPVVNTVTK